MILRGFTSPARQTVAEVVRLQGLRSKDSELSRVRLLRSGRAGPHSRIPRTPLRDPNSPASFRSSPPGLGRLPPQPASSPPRQPKSSSPECKKQSHGPWMMSRGSRLTSDFPNSAARQPIFRLVGTGNPLASAARILAGQKSVTPPQEMISPRQKIISPTQERISPTPEASLPQ